MQLRAPESRVGAGVSALQLNKIIHDMQTFTSEELLCPKRRPYKHVRRCPYGALECPGQCSLNVA